jgi:hypothetical protein
MMAGIAAGAADPHAAVSIADARREDRKCSISLTRI